MTISGKHQIEALNGVRCVLLEKEAGPLRAEFLKAVLQHNGYAVQLQRNVPPPPKAPKPAANADPDAPPPPPPPPPPPVPETYKVGVEDLSFVLSVMIFSRRLKTLDNQVLLPTYWTQEDPAFHSWYWLHHSASEEQASA